MMAKKTTFSSSPLASKSAAANKSSSTCKANALFSSSPIAVGRKSRDAAGADDEIEYPIRSILAETETEYVIDWENAADGTEYDPSAEPHKNASAGAIEAWEEGKKEQGGGDGKEAKLERVVKRVKVLGQWFYKIVWAGNEGYTVTWEPEKHLPEELVKSFLKRGSKKR